MIVLSLETYHSERERQSPRHVVLLPGLLQDEKKHQRPLLLSWDNCGKVWRGGEGRGGEEGRGGGEGLGDQS